MGIPKDITNENPGLGEWAFLVGYRGSIAHGMYVPNTDPNSIDDKDAMSICIPNLDYYWGTRTFGSRGTKEIMQGEWDIVIYEFSKFISLLIKGNPNVLGMLWLDPTHYLHIAPEAEELIESRDMFLGKHIKKSFMGYAKSQLHRMTHQSYQGYMGQKRKELVDKHGYDTKNASHLIRLLRMGLEVFVQNTLNVNRTEDATELLDIKRGEWSLPQVEREAARLFGLFEEAWVRSDLPNMPDVGKVNDLMVHIIKATFFSRGE